MSEMLIQVCSLIVIIIYTLAGGWLMNYSIRNRLRYSIHMIVVWMLGYIAIYAIYQSILTTGG